MIWKQKNVPNHQPAFVKPPNIERPPGDPKDDSPSIACSTASALRLHPATLALGQFQGTSPAEAAAPVNLGPGRPICWCKDCGFGENSTTKALDLVG